jgi:6-pyruvoyltetrahydropterin/6-carboxytetrahydropterin synthase
VYEVVVEDEFSAAHFLKLMDGSWEHRHGHDWKVAVTVQSDKLDSMEVVVDFEQLKPSLKKVLAEFEHTSFNDHPEFKGKKNSSTENIAKLIHDKLKPRVKSENARITKVTVWETPDACASYCP